MGIGWGPGGLTDSINRRAAREVRRQLAANPVARRARYGLGHRILRGLMSASCRRFLVLYLIVDLVALNCEGWLRIWWPAFLEMPKTRSAQAIEIVNTVPSYLLGAQIGLLGVMSLALALVTLVAQRDDAATDVKVYYHESMFFGITASGIALAIVLTCQFFWPLQTAFHLLGGGSGSVIFKLGLVALNAGWLTLNLWAMAYFISITFSFVQQSARVRMRERYTANVVFPRQLTQRLREHFYTAEGVSIDNSQPKAQFGYSLGSASEIEITNDFGSGRALINVHSAPVRWVVRRWSKRSASAPIAQGAGTNKSARIWFGPALDRELRGTVAWCRRSGGVALTSFERWVLARAFRFGEQQDEG